MLSVTLLRRRGRPGYTAGRVLWWDADDLHTGAAGNVHREDHVRVLHVRRALHEDHLLGTRLEDVLQATAKRRCRLLLAVDRELSTRQYLEHDLIRVRVIRLDLRVRIGELNVDRLPHIRKRGHEDDEQHEEHVDHWGDVDLVAQAARTATGHGHITSLLPPAARRARSQAESAACCRQAPS